MLRQDMHPESFPLLLGAGASPPVTAASTFGGATLVTLANELGLTKHQLRSALGDNFNVGGPGSSSIICFCY